MDTDLLRKIDSTDHGVLVTILATEGHTYKKKGEKALYEVGEPLPLCGNIGSGCVDQQIMLTGKAAFAARRPKVIRIDTTDPDDIVFGYGTYCGGVIEVLLEPVLGEQKLVYRELKAYLEGSGKYAAEDHLFLVHDTGTGAIHLSRERVSDDEHLLVEEIHMPVDLHLFGATPLAREAVMYISRMDFRVHVIDWRPGYLAKFEGMENVLSGSEPGEFDEDSMVLIMSHYYERDRDVLKEALLKGCAFIGLLSSRTRRDAIFEELLKDGIPESDIERVSSPVGIDINAESDSEIAVSIAAELIRFRNSLKKGSGSLPGEER